MRLEARAILAAAPDPASAAKLPRRNRRASSMPPSELELTAVEYTRRSLDSKKFAQQLDN